jgi:hypothetical protein
MIVASFTMKNNIKNNRAALLLKKYLVYNCAVCRKNFLNINFFASGLKFIV